MALTNPYPYSTPPIEIVQGNTSAPTILINKVGSSTTLMEAIVKQNIVNISYVYNPNPGAAYPWKTLTHLVIEMIGGLEHTFELQTVANHATWNDGTEEDAIQAVTDINASL